MGQVWEKDLPFNKAWVLMALADHADHQGNNVFPALPLIAWKTGYALSSIKRIVAELRDDGILKPYGHTPGGVVIYRIVLDHVMNKVEYIPPENGRPKGRVERVPRETPSQIDTGFCDTHNHQFSINKRDGGEGGGPRLPNRNSQIYPQQYDFPDSDQWNPFGDEDQ